MSELRETTPAHAESVAHRQSLRFDVSLTAFHQPSKHALNRALIDEKKNNNMHTHTNTLNHMSVIHSHVIKIWVIFHIAAHRKKKVNVITPDT